MEPRSGMSVNGFTPWGSSISQSRIFEQDMVFALRPRTYLIPGSSHHKET